MKATGEWSGPKKEEEKERDLEYPEHLLYARHGMILYIFLISPHNTAVW